MCVCAQRSAPVFKKKKWQIYQISYYRFIIYVIRQPPLPLPLSVCVLVLENVKVNVVLGVGKGCSILVTPPPPQMHDWDKGLLHSRPVIFVDNNPPPTPHPFHYLSSSWHSYYLVLSSIFFPIRLTVLPVHFTIANGRMWMPKAPDNTWQYTI